MWLGLNFFKHLSVQDCNVFDAGVVDHILTTKFPELDFPTLSQEAFRAFEFYFRFSNWEHKTWKPKDNGSSIAVSASSCSRWF